MPVISPSESIAERAQKKDLVPASSTWSCADIATRHERGDLGEVELDWIVKKLGTRVMPIDEKWNSHTNKVCDANT